MALDFDVTVRRLVSLLWIGVVACSSLLAAESWPPGFDDEVVVANLDGPTAFGYAPDGRIFVAEKGGHVRVVTADGQLLPTPFATVSVTSVGDLGLIGIVLDPDFLDNRYIYLSYTTDIVPPVPENPFSRIHRITRMTANGNVAVAGSEVILIDDIPSDSTTHVGGAMHFGPDGRLYVTTGDGATPFDVDPLALRSLDVDELNGKVLRINPDGSVPTDNPFYTTPDAARSKVWQLGLRNPFKATFRPGTTTLYVNDVGWNDWEEVNVAPAGASFGWPCFEGAGAQAQYSSRFSTQCGSATNTLPLYTYPHSEYGGAITGGAFYEGANYPAQFAGKYFVGDYAQQTIRYLEVTPDDEFVSSSDFGTGDSSFTPVDLLLAPDGNLHYLNFASDHSVPSGSIRRIVYVGAGNHAPKPKAAAVPMSGYAPLSVSFTAAGTTDADEDPLSYHWRFGDGAEADGLTAQHTYVRDGVFVAVLEVDDTHTTRESTVPITVGSSSPRAQVLAPTPPAVFVAGQTVAYSGSAWDPDEGTLAPENLRWTVLLHHTTHQHIYQSTVGTGGSFAAEGHGTAGETYWYEVILTATDSSGLESTKRVSVHENVAPTANAGADRTAHCSLPSRVTLDGTASGDANAQPIAYQWTQISGPPVVLTGATTARPSFTAPAVSGGTALTFRLEVSDTLVSTTDTVTVTVPNLTDADGDGAPACSDCSPQNSAVRPPLETTALRFLDKTNLSWNPATGASVYDLLRGTLARPFAYDHSCVLADLASTTGSDPQTPTPGSAYYYVSRGRSSCGPGDLGVDSDGTPLPNPTCGSTQTIPFDDAPGQDQALNGQYPAGVIDWGQNVWYLSGPWQIFTTKSISFSGAGATQASFAFVAPRALLRLDAYNGGTAGSTVTISCAGQPPGSIVVPAGQIATIDTGWTSACTPVTLGSSNGWFTNFDNLLVRP